MKYVNIILYIILSWFFAYSKATPKKIDFFSDNNLYSYVIGDTVVVSHTIQMNSELEWATRLIQAESRSESKLGKIAVVQTILNRVEYNTYRGRNTDFFWEIRRPGQIDGYGTKNWRRSLERENILIAYKALYGPRVIPKSIYFWHNECTSTDKTHINNTEGPDGEYIWLRIDNHTFCHSKHLLKNHPDFLDTNLEL